jgi:hypothetical protein
MPSSGETEGNTDANSQLGAVDMTSRCTIRISRPKKKELRLRQDNNSATLLAAARAYNARPGRSVSATSLLTEFRASASESGRKYLQERTLDKARLSSSHLNDIGLLSLAPK